MNEIKIGHVIKRVLRQQHRTLKETSKDTGIPYSTLHTWQENRQPKDIIKVQRLAEYLGLSLHELLFDQRQQTDQLNSTPLGKQSEDFFKGTFEIIVRRINDP